MAQKDGLKRLVSGLLVFLCLDWAPVQAEPPTAPERVVSVNLCSDILVQLLARPEQIASLTFMASEDADNPLAVAAKDYFANHGLSEEILPLQPDLVLAHQFTSPFLISMMRRFGVPVVQIEDGSSLETLRRNVRRVAEALGRQREGEALLTRFDLELAEAARSRGANAPRAMLFQDKGATAGPGDLLSDLMTHAGLVNVARERTGAWRSVTIEDVIRAEPDLLLIGQYRNETRSQSNAVLAHPALAAALGEENIYNVPAKYWICGTPFVSRIASEFAQISDTHRARQGQ